MNLLKLNKKNKSLKEFKKIVHEIKRRNSIWTDWYCFDCNQFFDVTLKGSTCMGEIRCKYCGSQDIGKHHELIEAKQKNKSSKEYKKIIYEIRKEGFETTKNLVLHFKHKKNEAEKNQRYTEAAKFGEKEKQLFKELKKLSNIIK